MLEVAVERYLLINGCYAVSDASECPVDCHGEVESSSGTESSDML